MEKEKERDKRREEWLKSIIEINKKLKKLMGEEEDDYYFYLHLIYPFDSNPSSPERKLQFYPEIE